MTNAGTILGTAAYMSPDQARGKPVDRRADVWAFGCVLCEMLTGKLAFGGETVTDVFGAIVRAEPDWTALPVHTPSSVRRLLARCLQKGDRLYVADEIHRIIEFPVDRSRSFEIGAPSARVVGNALLVGGYDRAASGTEFLVPVASTGGFAPARLLVIQNWIPEPR